MKLSVIVPAYNEGKRLPKTLSEMDVYLRKQDYEYEILVVNDGSSDNTAKAVKDLEGQIRGLRLIDNTENKGKGGVVKQGMLEAKGEYRLFIDADHSTTINHIDRVWPAIEKGADVVIGTRDARDHEGAEQSTKQPLWKRLMGDVGNVVIQTLLLPGIWDTQCGFKLFSEEAAKRVFREMKDYRWAFDVEVLKLARKMGYRTEIIPVKWIDSPDSRFKIKGYIRFFKGFFKIVLRFWTRQYSYE